jgi:hypothetical protein
MSQPQQAFAVVACVLVLGGILLGPVGSVSAQINGIEVSSEWFQSTCQLGNDVGPGIRTVYVRHLASVGSVASRFRVSLGEGTTMTYLSESQAFSTSLGDTQNGISVCYGECLAGDIVLVEISYMSYATDSNCSRIQVVPHSEALTIETIDCFGVAASAFSQDLYIVAPGESCGCPTPRSYSGTPQLFSCNPVPVETSTWGFVKALYR